MIEQKFSTTIDNNSRLCSSSRLRSRNSSRPRSRKSPRLQSITVLDYDQETSRLRSISLKLRSRQFLKKKKKNFLNSRHPSSRRFSIETGFNLLIIYLTILCNHTNRSPPLYATFLYLLQEMAGKDPSTRTPTRPKLPAPRRPSPSNAPSGSTSEPVDAPRPGEYPRLTPSPGYWHILHSSWNLYQPQNCHSYL